VSIDPYPAQLVGARIEDRADDLALRIPHELNMRQVVTRRSKLVLGNWIQTNGLAEVEVEDRPESVRLTNQTVGTEADIDVDAPRLNEIPDDDDSVRSFNSDGATSLPGAPRSRATIASMWSPAVATPSIAVTMSPARNLARAAGDLASAPKTWIWPPTRPTSTPMPPKAAERSGSRTLVERPKV
jgi:hypothetical protein